MKLGVALPTAGAWASAESQLRVARDAESMGYASLWTLQRLLLPTVPQNEYPPLAGQPMPEYFGRVFDPIVTLAFVASATSSIRLGVSVLVMPFYAPAVLAKQLASLDVLSGGRLDVGVGLGWSKDEYDAVGVPFERRGARGDEFLRCLKTIWTEPEPEFVGEFYRVPRSRVEPRPLQRPHPPILVGGYGPLAARRAVRLGDGFAGGNVPLREVRALINELHRVAESEGRDPASLRIVCRGTFRLHDTLQGPGRRPLFGTLGEIRDDVQRYADAGLTELFLEGNIANLPPERRLPDLLTVMEALAPVATP